jgi:putative ABC transport system permease protein
LAKDLIMRYAERSPVGKMQGEASPQKARPSSPSPSMQNNESPSGEAYSVVSREHILKIVGISDLDPDSMRGAARARVFLPLKLAQELHVLQPSDLRDTTRTFDKTPTYTTLSVRVRSPKYVQAVEDAVKKMGFNTFSIVDATRSLRQFFAVLDLFLGIFGSLALAVASLGIVNTLVMAILERRREIGTMKALGAGDGDIQRLFFAEAGAMGVLGGVVGVVLGWMLGRVINLGTNVYLKRQNFPPEQIWSVPWWLVAGAIVFAIAVSLLSGLYPALCAARLDPVQALRYE